MRAEPLLGEDGQSAWVPKPCPRLPEPQGASSETVICFQHEPRKQDGQLVASTQAFQHPCGACTFRQFQRLLDPKEMAGLSRLTGAFQAPRIIFLLRAVQEIRGLEGQEESSSKLQVEMSGLLPWTSYVVSAPRWGRKS